MASEWQLSLKHRTLGRGINDGNLYILLRCPIPMDLWAYSMTDMKQ